MKKILLPFLLLGLLCSPIFAQERHKPKPEEEETGKAGVVKTKPIPAQQNPIRRAKVHQTSFRRLGGMKIGLLSGEYMGFGATYQMNRHTPFGWTFSFYYFTIPGKQLFFDPYYYELVQRNKGSMIMLLGGARLQLPFLRNEPNINPYGIVGVGPVLGIENDLERQWPGSITHAFSVGGITAYGGAGIEYQMNTWVLGFDARYQLLRFPQRIFSEKAFDGFTFSFGVGKLF